MPRQLPFRPSMHLRRRSDFARVYREGSRARGDGFTVAVCPNDTGRTRLGLSVGKVVSKAAVRRNRVRRLLREAFRHAFPELPTGLDVVLIARPPGPGAAGPGEPVDPAELGATLARLARKALRRYREKVAKEAEA